MRLLILSIFTLILPFLSQAQLYEKEKSQHRFAQAYIGLNTQFLPSSGQMHWAGSDRNFAAAYTPRFTIGGLHFWGHLDFKMNFGLYRFGNFQLDQDTEYNFRYGGDLSAHYYPWAVKDKYLRPFIGIGFNTMAFVIRNKDLGARADGFLGLSASAGLSYTFKNWQINAYANYLPFNQKSFYVDRQNEHQLKLPPLYYSLGIIRYFDVTLREEKPMQSGVSNQLEQELETEGKLNSLSIGVGLTSSYFFKSPKYQSPDRQSLPKHKAVITYDLNLGYFWHKAAIHAGASYRDYTSSVNSYGLEQLIRRRSIALEGYKFLLDYNGFVPFIGPSLSYERWGTAEFDQDVQEGNAVFTQNFNLGIIFGWDIVASPLETWLLRTNLRYYPFQKINDMEGKKSRVDQFEFNFIQVVFYPQRMYHIPKAKKRVNYY